LRAKSNADCHLLRTLSRLTQVQDPTGTYGFTYDNMNRLTQTSTAYSFLPSRTFTVQYGYDAASNRASMTDPENGTTHYNYDTLNRLSSLNDFQSHNFTFSYDALSRRYPAHPAQRHQHQLFLRQHLAPALGSAPAQQQHSGRGALAEDTKVGFGEAEICELELKDFAGTQAIQ